ncbi:MAG: ParB/RepB/Spo0J family partition protein [Comamonas sp.]
MATQKDPLIDRLVTINSDATTTKGLPLAQAGQKAKVIGKTPTGRQYQLDCDGTLVNLPMSDFVLVTIDGVTPQLKTSVNAEQPHAVLQQITPSRTNRTVVEDDELHEMAASIKAHGILQPLLLRKLPAERLQDTFENTDMRKAEFEIIAGERRFAAARIAGLRKVPYMLVEADNLQAVQLQLIENLHRKNLNPLEEARGIALLIEEFGLSRDEAAVSIRKGRTHVFESMRLLSLQPKAMAALKEGRLSRSLALLVLQRPTAALQEEFVERILTGGPDGGPMSTRSAEDLARRNYMTVLEKAPFDLTDALLCPQAGACSNCPKRTGATPELFDKQGPDACTDTACFAEKKEAHLAQVKADAVQAGRQVISGKAARDIMPTETGSMRGYIALDKASQGSKAETRQVLGQEVPASRVVLIETPSGGYTEAVPMHAASAAVQEKAQEGKAKPAPKANNDKSQAPTPDRATLQAEYERRWRERAVTATIAGLATCTEDEVNHLPSWISLHVLEKLAADVPKAQLMLIFDIADDKYYDDALSTALTSASEAALPAKLVTMMQMVCTQDLKTDKPTVFYYLEELQNLADFRLVGIQNQVQVEMKAEAAQRAGKAPAKPTSKKAEPKVKQQEASAAIAQAMQAADADASPAAFEPGQTVRIKVDLRGAENALLPTRQRLAVIKQKMGDRAFLIELPADPHAHPTDMTERWVISADYTELQAVEAQEELA